MSGWEIKRRATGIARRPDKRMDNAQAERFKPSPFLDSRGCESRLGWMLKSIGKNMYLPFNFLPFKAR